MDRTERLVPGASSEVLSTGDQLKVDSNESFDRGREHHAVDSHESRQRVTSRGGYPSSPLSLQEDRADLMETFQRRLMSRYAQFLSLFDSDISALFHSRGYRGGGD